MSNYSSLIVTMKDNISMLYIRGQIHDWSIADEMELAIEIILELEKALQPFAAAADNWLPEELDDRTAGAKLEHPKYGLEQNSSFTFGDLFNARSVLDKVHGESM